MVQTFRVALYSYFYIAGIFIMVTGHTYQRKATSSNGKVFTFKQTSVKWDAANQICKNYGGLLAIVQSSEEHNLIVQNLMKMNGESYYVGGRKDGGKWTWLDGSSIKGNTHWGHGEPNNCGEGEDRLEYLLHNGTFAWNDISFSEEKGYICQFDACNFSCTKDGACVQRHSNDVCVCDQNLDIVSKCNIDCSSVDLLFAVDTSLSLENNTCHTADNINMILDRLLLDDDSFNVAVMSYDLNQTEHIKLGQYRKDEIKKAIKEISLITSSSPTFTGKALRRGIEILSSGDTYQIIVLMSDGLSSDRQDAITSAELFTISPYHIVVCIGVGRRIDHMELIQLASRDHLGEYGPLVFPSTTQDARNMIAKLTMRKTCIDCRVSYSSDVIIIQDNAVHAADFSYSIDVATEISRRYLLTKKDVRLGRLSYHTDEFTYHQQNVAFLSLIQKIDYAKEQSREMELLLSQAKTLFQSPKLQRNKVVVIISDGRWSNVSRVQEQMEALQRQNVTVMVVAISEHSDFTTIYNVVWDPFYVFYINDKTRWSVIDVIVSQSFRVYCNIT